MKPDNTISEMVQQYKNEKDDNSLLFIVNKMKPLINKYARALYCLEYEDMQQELIIALIEAVHKLKECDNEGKVIRFLVTGVKNRFYELYRKQIVKKTEQNCDMQSMVNVVPFYEKFCDIEYWVDIASMKFLSKTPVKRKIAEYILNGEASDSEIAKRLHISRQYVNRCKKEIFSELLKY